MPLDTKAITSEIEAILAKWGTLEATAKYDDYSDLEGSTELTAVITAISAAIDRFAPPNSHYIKLQQQILASGLPSSPHVISPLAGVLSSLRDDIAAGRLCTITELLHADVFRDLLDMTQHLLNEGYKDAAAVMAGGVLEGHLRTLCPKFGVLTTAGTKPKKADAMNAELVAASAYSKSDQKSVTAWLGLRNDAAHGNYTAYKSEQVALIIQGVRDFITRNPA